MGTGRRYNPLPVTKARFLATLIHFIGMVICWADSYSLLIKSIGRPGISEKQFNREYASAQFSFQWLCGISILLFGIEFFGMFLGHCFTMPKFNLYSTVSHTLGAFYTTWCILEAWRYESVFYIFFLFHLLPALLELIFSVDHILFKSRILSRVEIRLPENAQSTR